MKKLSLKEASRPACPSKNRTTPSWREDSEENALINAALRFKLEAIEALPGVLDKLLEKAEEHVDEVNEYLDAAAKFTAELRKAR